jgi:hypothetical protein
MQHRDQARLFVADTGTKTQTDARNFLHRQMATDAGKSPQRRHLSALAP